MQQDQRPHRERPPWCPPWCVLHHGIRPSEDDHVHASAALQVRRTELRLCASTDAATGRLLRPYVRLGHDEYALFEAEALIDALTEIADHARLSLPAEEPEGALPVLDAELLEDRRDVDAHGRG